jgi:nucleoside-diphosphate-sugar epimerase
MTPRGGQRRHLVTGATGFVGRHLVEGLLADGGVGALVAMVPPRRPEEEERAYQRWRAAGVRLVECDLLDLPRGGAAPPEYDVVYHLAGHTRTEAPSPNFHVNSEGTRNLLRWLGPTLAGKHVVAAATLASVDHPRFGRAVDETTDCRPRTAYGRTKLLGETYLRNLQPEFGYTYTILRLCTIIGPGYRPAGMFGLLPAMLRRGALATRLNWPGHVSFLHVDDLVRLLRRLPDCAGARNELFVVGNGENPTFNSVLAEMASVLGCPRPTLRLPGWLWRVFGALAWQITCLPLVPHAPRTLCWRLSHMIYDGLSADAAKLEAVLGLRYRSFKDGLREIYGGGEGREAAPSATLNQPPSTPSPTPS